MAFADPQTITVNTVPKTLNRISSNESRSIYTTDDELYKFTISHQVSKDSVRHMVRIDRKVAAADPLTAVTAYRNLGVYLVIDEPSFGFTVGDVTDVVVALELWLDATSVAKMVSNQH